MNNLLRRRRLLLNNTSIGKRGKPPILQGDYIWYRLDPSVPDYLNDNGTRKVDDVGNTVMNGANPYGRYNGIMYSGKSFTLSGDGYLDVPINLVLGSDIHTIIRNFVSNDDEITTYTKHDETSFDLAVITAGTNIARPSLYISENINPLAGEKYFLSFNAILNSGDAIISYYNNGYSTPSINYHIKNGYNEILLEFVSDYTDIVLYFNGTNLFDISVTDIQVHKLESVQGSVTYFDAATKEFVQETNLPLEPNYRLENGTFGTIIVLWDRQFTQDDIDAMNADPELAIQFGLGHNVLSIMKEVDDKVYAATDVDGDILYEIGAVESLTLQGTYTRNTKVNYGVQTLRLKLDSVGIPIEFINTNQMKFSSLGNKLVNTGIVIDGSATDFTMMMAFTLDFNNLPVIDETIVTSEGIEGTDNKITLRYDSTAQTVNVVIGQNIFDVTTHLDTGLTNHAMVAIYDHATGEVLGAADGASLASFGAVTFDGATLGTIIFGNNHDLNQPYHGLIGEGILSATKEDENAWLVFYDRIKEAEHIIHLSSHPQFNLVSNVSDKYYFDKDTNEVIFKNSTSIVANYRFGGIYSERAIITAENYSTPAGNRNWVIPFAKFKDNNNIVGARLNDGKIEIVQRRNGIWTTLTSVAAVEGSWEVHALNSNIEVFVNGVSQVSIGHQITGFAYFGISGHQWEVGETRVFSNYNVVPQN